jgi:hypothetical protein
MRDEPALESMFSHGLTVELATDGSRRAHDLAPGQVLLPGAFNPAHEGHWKLAEAGRIVLGRDVAFELSLANVDKPDLAWDAAERRAEQFRSRATIWITRAPTFLQKAELFPQAVFVVGADTAVRIVQARYYGAGEDSIGQALRFLRERECRFLVGCRVDADENVIRLADLPIPPEFRSLFTEISPEIFRVDLSSTQLRREVGS